MKFKTNKTQYMAKIGELSIGDTFIDTKNFTEEEVFMIVNTKGYDCLVEFDDDMSEIAAVNLTTGELWSYTRDEEVTLIKTEDVTFKPISR